MTQTIGHWGFPAPEASEPPDGPSQIAALGTFLNGNVNGRVPMANQGVLSARPVSTVGVPGKRDRRFLVVGDPTPSNNGREFIDTGTSWVEVFGNIPDGSISTAKLADGAVTDIKVAANISGSKLTDATVTGAKLVNGAVAATQIAAALKPSAGAANATEALRALGTSAGMALPGNQAAGGSLAGTYPNPILAPPLVSALPTAGLTPGMVVAYANDAMEAMGVVWHFRYNPDSMSTYLWEFIGGGEMAASDTALYSSVTVAWVSAGAATLTIPLAGDYVFSMASLGKQAGTNPATDVMSHGLAIVLGAVVNLGMAYHWHASSLSNVTVSGSTGRVPQYGCTAGGLVRPKFKTSTGASQVSIWELKFSLIPVRVI